MQAHPFSELFPLLPQDELLDLADDIKRNGLQHNIVVFEQKVLDGRSRLRACELAKVEPRVITYRGTDPLGYVISQNLRRRHLTTAQRAWIANQLATMKRGCRIDLPRPAELREVGQAEAAALMNVSERSVQAARVVAERGTVEDVEQVKSGEVSLSRAERIIRDKIDDIKEAAKADPKRYGDLLQRLEAKEKVNPIHRELKKRERATTTKGEELNDRAGNPVPDHLKDLFFDPWFHQVCEGIEEFNRDVIPKIVRLVERKGGRYRFVLTGDIIKTLKAVGEELRGVHSLLDKNRPHAVCPTCKGQAPAKNKECDGCRNGGFVPEWRMRELKGGK